MNKFKAIVYLNTDLLVELFTQTLVDVFIAQISHVSYHQHMLRTSRDPFSSNFQYSLHTLLSGWDEQSLWFQECGVNVQTSELLGSTTSIKLYCDI